MEKKNPMTFTMGIVAIILGVVLYKQFDLQTMTFEKPALAALYAIVFAFAVGSLIRNARNR